MRSAQLLFVSGLPPRQRMAAVTRRTPQRVAREEFCNGTFRRGADGCRLEISKELWMKFPGQRKVPMRAAALVAAGAVLVLSALAQQEPGSQAKKEDRVLRQKKGRRSRSGRLPMRVPVGTECSPQSGGCTLPA
jgi:hypothetical protein